MKEIKKTAEQAYNEIFAKMREYKDICIFDIEELKEKADYHLFGLKLKNDFGLNINPKEIYSLDYIQFDDYKSVGWWGGKYRRFISNSDKQPNHELLFRIAFHTGAYIFGNDYPETLFQKFWNELKSYNPDYLDELNHSLYWKIENAKEIFNKFDEILERYKKVNEKDSKMRQIEILENKLRQLQEESGGHETS